MTSTMLLTSSLLRRTSSQLRRIPLRSFSAVPSLLHDERPFDRVLIANRGEIALRVMRTCDALGIETVAMYTTADAQSPFVQHATHSVCIGNNYLNTDAIHQAIVETQAQAVHPGYGFLSENAKFASMIANDTDATWLGPSGHAIQSMGDKLKSKEIAKEAGVHILAGHDGIIENVEHALQVANEVGYPVLLKAAAGGGGKGMRVCYNDAEIVEAFGMATQEAIKFFASDELLIEKYMENPHHIEFQLLAGHCPQNNDELEVAVFCERECSIQRRNQKIIEESPSCLLTPDTREKMMHQVVRLAKQVDYTSAGTVEFLVNEQQEFFFLEMNTRLQVEHPITEAVSHNVDLVKGMLYVGANWGLPPECKPPKGETHVYMPHKGHAIEARIYAEDPLRSFLPSTGPLVPYQEPSHVEGIRVDSGVTAGFRVSTLYDPMLSKVISFSPQNRQEAVDGLVEALDNYVIGGVQHNARLCGDVLRHPEFQKGNTPTSFLPLHFPDGWKGVELNDTEKAQFVVAATLVYKDKERKLGLPPVVLKNGHPVVRLGGMFGPAYRVEDQKDGASFQVTRLNSQEGEKDNATDSWTVQVHEPMSLDGVLAKIAFHPTTTPTTLQILGFDKMGTMHLQMKGANLDMVVQSSREYELTQHMKPPRHVDMSNVVPTPMPGTLISYAVQEGDEVVEGQEVCIVEAMKMQNVIRAPRSGVVEKCHFQVGSSLMADQILLNLVPEGK